MGLSTFHALDSRLERESRWTRKTSTTCEANRIFQDNLNEDINIPAIESERNRAIQKNKEGCI
jgi:hypothetical protein